MPSSRCSPARPQTLTALCVQIMCLTDWTLSSEAARPRCGSELLSDLIFVCGDRGFYVGKGSRYGYSSRPRGKGIVDQCCRPGGCELYYLEMYCAEPRSPQRPPIPPATTKAAHTTLSPASTTAAHTTTTTTPTTLLNTLVNLQSTIPPATTTAAHTTISPATTTAAHTTIPPATTTAAHTTIPPATTKAAHTTTTTSTSTSTTTTSTTTPTTLLNTAQQFVALFHKRLLEQLGAPDSPKRESSRKRKQPSVQQRGKGSSSKRRSKPESTSSRPPSASRRGMRFKS